MCLRRRPVGRGAAVKIKITWVEHGTNNAACLGLDETIDLDPNEGQPDLEEYRQDALYCGSCDRDDPDAFLDHYDVIVELLEE
jgi:hypothetical protein